MASVTISPNRAKINAANKSTVSVLADYDIYAIEIRATAAGAAWGRGIGYDLLSDDLTTSNGVYVLPVPSTSFSFDVESAELSTDGSYRVSVFIRDAAGIWNDTCPLLTADNEPFVDANGSYVLVARASGEESYTSTYTGAQIDAFIEGVLGL